MHLAFEVIGWTATVLALAGAAYQVLAGFRVRAFRARPALDTPATAPAVTILKPLYGAEPGLEAALASFLHQDYPGRIQVIFGVQDTADAALPVVEALRRANPDRDIALVVDAILHGSNRKISNLINMMTYAEHDVILLADSDIVVHPNYLRHVLVELETPGVGVVTCPYYGEARGGVWARLAAMGLNFQFLPSVAVGVTLGLATPCMGSTIALRRDALNRIGGFAAFADLLADDYAIGAAVRALGLRSVVAPMVVGHLCTEASLGELMRHELRWAVTVRGADPVGFAGSGVTHAAPLAIVGVLFTLGAPESLAVLAIALICRLWMLRQVEKLVPIEHGGWRLVLVRDILSFAVFAGSFFVRAVEWRGARFRVDPQGALERL